MSVKQEVEKAEEFKERGDEWLRKAMECVEKALQCYRLAEHHFEAALTAENLIDPQEFARKEAQLKRKKVKKK